MVERGQEYREGRVDADHPGESEQVVEEGQQHGYPDDHLQRAGHGFEERTPLAARPPLLDADHAHEAGPARWLLASGNAPVVESFVEEEDDGDETQPGLDAVQTESPLPFLGGDDEGGEEGAEVGGEHDEGGPDVDFARVLVQVEEIFDEHETTLCRD